MNSWLGYRSHFVRNMCSLKLSMFEKVVFGALLLVLAINVADAVQRGGLDNQQTAAGKDTQAQAEWMAQNPEEK